MNLLQYFEYYLSAKPSTNGWYEFTCPVCGRDKGAMHPEQKQVKCWRGCYQTDAVGFLVHTLGLSWSAAFELAGTRTMTLEHPVARKVDSVLFPEGYRPLNYLVGSIGQRAATYMQERGFNTDELGSEGWGYCDEGKYFGRIIIPYFSNRKLRGYTARDFMGNPLRYMNPSTEDLGVGKSEVMFNEDALRMYHKVYLTEGAIDARTLGLNGVATGGWSVSPTQMAMLSQSKATKILVPDLGNAPDGESFLRKALKKVAIPLVEAGSAVGLCDYSAYAQWGKDANRIGAQAVLSTEVMLDYSTIMKYLYA